MSGYMPRVNRHPSEQWGVARKEPKADWEYDDARCTNIIVMRKTGHRFKRKRGVWHPAPRSTL